MKSHTHFYLGDGEEAVKIKKGKWMKTKNLNVNYTDLPKTFTFTACFMRDRRSDHNNNELIIHLQ